MLVFLLLLAQGCIGDTDSGLEGFLPTPDEVSGIRTAGRPQTYEGKKLFDYIDGGADLFHEYNFQQACVQRYKTPQGEVTVEIYQMDTPAHAFGIYTFDTEGEHISSAGQDATYAQGLLSFWKDRFFVRIFAQTEGLKETIMALAQTIARKIPHEGARPDILTTIPPQGVVPDSILYFRGMIALNNVYFLSHENVLSLGNGAEGVTFRYMQESESLRVIMVRYRDAAQSEKSFRTLCSSGLIKNGRSKDGVCSGRSRRGYGAAKVDGNLVLLVLDGKDPETVAAALNALPHKGGAR